MWQDPLLHRDIVDGSTLAFGQKRILGAFGPRRTFHIQLNQAQQGARDTQKEMVQSIAPDLQSYVSHAPHLCHTTTVSSRDLYVYWLLDS